MEIKINQLERTTADDVVTIAHWSASVEDTHTEEGYTDVEGNEVPERVVVDYSASAYGTQSFTRDADSPELVPFEDLTEETVVGWVLNSFPKVTVVTQEAVEATYDDDGNVVTEAVEEVREETDQYQMEVNLLAKIEEQKAPQMVTGKPWDVVLEEVA
jgi:hypothetical protein